MLLSIYHLFLLFNEFNPKDGKIDRHSVYLSVLPSVDRQRQKTNYLKFIYPQLTIKIQITNKIYLHISVCFIVNKLLNDKNYANYNKISKMMTIYFDFFVLLLRKWQQIRHKNPFFFSHTKSRGNFVKSLAKKNKHQKKTNVFGNKNKSKVFFNKYMYEKN